jgi:hypothetical protein
MHFGKFHFGSIAIDGVIYEHDVVIDRGKIRKRKKPSKQFRKDFGHTPVSVEDKVPWKCRRLVVGTGRYGSLQVMDEGKRRARGRKTRVQDRNKGRATSHETDAGARYGFHRD